MPQIKIGEKTLTTRRPSDLDAKLVASTGCNAAELAGMIGSAPDLAARALRPFLPDDAPSVPELARTIAADQSLVPAIAALLGDAPAAAETPAAKA